MTTQEIIKSLRWCDNTFPHCQRCEILCGISYPNCERELHKLAADELERLSREEGTENGRDIEK